MTALGSHDAGSAPLAPLERRLACALADTLVHQTQLLSDLAYDLAANPVTLRAHMESLQAIDRMTQVQLAIADVLRSDVPIDARVKAITLESLSEDLSRQLRLDPLHNGGVGLS